MTISEFENVLKKQYENYVKTDNFFQIVRCLNNYEDFNLCVLKKGETIVFVRTRSNGDLLPIITNHINTELLKILNNCETKDNHEALIKNFSLNGFKEVEYDSLKYNDQEIFESSVFNELGVNLPNLFSLKSKLYTAYIIPDKKNNQCVVLFLFSLDGYNVNECKMIGELNNDIIIDLIDKINYKRPMKKLSANKTISIKAWEQKLNKEFNYIKTKSIEKFASYFQVFDEPDYKLITLKKDDDVIFLRTSTGEILNAPILTNRVNTFKYDFIVKYIEKNLNGPIYIKELLNIAKQEGYKKISFNKLDKRVKDLYKQMTKLTIADLVEDEFIDENLFYAGYIINGHINDNTIHANLINSVEPVGVLILSKDNINIYRYYILNNKGLINEGSNNITENLFLGEL